MGVANFFSQKSRLNEIQDDIDRMIRYVKLLNNYTGEIDACWIGNRDKSKVAHAISSHLNDVTEVATNINIFKQTAIFVLEKMNELGSLIGLHKPEIVSLWMPPVNNDFRINTRINLDTDALRNVAEKIDRNRTLLEDTTFSIKDTKNVIDNMILNIFGLNLLLKTIDRNVANLISDNQKIVNTIRNISDLYETTEKRLVKKIEEINMSGETQNNSREAFIYNKNMPYVFMKFNNGYINPDLGDYFTIGFSKWNDDLFEKISGNYDKERIKKNLAELLEKVNRTGNSCPDNIVPEEIKEALALLKSEGKFDKAFADKYSELIKKCGGVENIIKYGEKGLEAVTYLFSDYSNSLATLEKLREADINNPDLNEAVDELITQYSNKFVGSLSNIFNYIVSEEIDKIDDKIISTAVGKVGGGLYTIASLTTDVISNATGMDQRAESLETNAAATIYQGSFVAEYQNAMIKLGSGNYTESDVDNAERLFYLSKAATIQPYESALVIADTEEQKVMFRTDLKKINDLTFGIVN